MVSKQRVICGLSVAAVWLLAIFVLPIWCLAGLVIASAGVCLYELCTMLKKAGYQMPFWTIAGAGLVWMGMVTAALMLENPSWAFSLPFLPVVLSMVLFFRVLLDDKIEKSMPVMALSVASFIYIPVMLSALIVIAMIPHPSAMTEGYAAGIFLAFFLALITKLCDTGGYFVGSTWGKHKMCPRLSPGKSWEGTAGGYAFSLIATTVVILLAKFTDWDALAWIRTLTDGVGMTIWFYVTILVVIAVGILGDLVESLFKRQCGVKDSSALFPAMGGFFDTFDSLIFVPVTFIFMQVLGFLLFN